MAAVKAKAGATIKECDAEFEISNFQATCAMTKTISEGKLDCREIVSGPILVAKKFKFGIAVAWSVKADGAVEESKNLGVHVKRLDDSPEECTISLEMTILNKKPGFQMTLCDPSYHGIHSGKARGWSRSFDMPENRRHDGVKGLPLQDVFDPAGGWLHHGALRVIAKLSVVISADSSQSTPSPLPSVSGQQEVCDALQALLRSGQMADVVIKAGDVSIDCHSLILAARSPVFERMFACPMKEKKEREIISDLEAPSVKALVEYLYCGAVEDSVLESDDSCLNLLEAAHRYEVPGLVEQCVQVLVSRFHVETVAERLETAELIGSRPFKAQCLDFIHSQMAEVQDTEAYHRLVERRPSLLKDIIEVMLPPAKKLRKVKGSAGR
eukprot:TRINITY_DN37184_c0_g1_i1.p1 TRINITY_DN37184_c0_g1~~TRINITY_DN37184_c0_g1_i1.p1  ORF type:complete len:406 (+),score=87.80 TRINITY_DN37184_c0_g1_i1:70-1218(+)